MSNLLNFIRTIIREQLNEVNYITPTQFGKDKRDNKLDGTKLRVYHGIDRTGILGKILKKGLSGREIIKRINSNDTASANGLFVTIDFNLAKQYANSDTIIEFTVDTSDLIPVSDGASGTYSYDTAYNNLLSSTKSEALFVGDLNPNMIKYVWQKSNNKWNRYGRKEFIKNNAINTKRSKFDIFLPNDDFDINVIINFFNNDTTSSDFKRFIKQLNTVNPDKLSAMRLFYPKQIDQIISQRNNGEFNKYV